MFARKVGLGPFRGVSIRRQGGQGGFGLLGVGRGWEVCGLRRGLEVGVGMQEQAPAESPFVMKQSTLASPEERTNSRERTRKERDEKSRWLRDGWLRGPALVVKAKPLSAVTWVLGPLEKPPCAYRLLRQATKSTRAGFSFLRRGDWRETRSLFSGTA
jgi:hypothetical protein